jgi:hypothetical protein
MIENLRANITSPVDSEVGITNVMIHTRVEFAEACERVRKKLNVAGDDESFFVLLAGYFEARARTEAEDKQAGK